MPQVELSAGMIDYVDTGGAGPVLVLTHGMPMSPTQWRKVLPLLSGYRCVLPTLPLGGHRIPMHPQADLTQFGVARLLGEFVERLDLQDVTLVLNDWGGGQFLVTERFAGSERVARLALVACEAFDNMPPGPAKPISVVTAVPGGVWLLWQLLRVRAIRDHRNAYGGMSVRGIPDDVLADWFRPGRASRAIRRDIAKFATGAPSRETLLGCSERLRDFDRPPSSSGRPRTGSCRASTARGWLRCYPRATWSRWPSRRLSCRRTSQNASPKR